MSDKAVPSSAKASAAHHNASRVTRHALPYFPGCALKDQARGFEDSARAAMAALGYELAELPRWNCCGTVYSLATDDLMRHLGPVRNLVRVQDLGETRLVTLCAMCYNTLARSSRFVGADPERLERINAFMDDEADYRGGVEVVHLLELLRDEVTFEAIEAKVERPLDGLKVAPYYGCMLLRPREVGIDDPDSPGVLEALLSALGAEPVDFPQKAECCGAYQTVSSPEIARARVGEIVSAARWAGAELIATSCPLCTYNLEHHQVEREERETRHASPVTRHEIPILYFTQLLALALGVSEDKLGFAGLKFDPRPLLSDRELV